MIEWLALAAAAAPAARSCETLSYTVGTYHEPQVPTYAASLPAFDPSLGTLQAVVLRLRMTGYVAHGSFSVPTSAHPPCTFTNTLCERLSAVLNGDDCLFDEPLVSVQECHTFVEGPFPPEGHFSRGAPLEGQSPPTYLDPSMHAAFTGTGTVAIDVCMRGSYSSQVEGDCTQLDWEGSYAPVTGELTVTYLYTTAPLVPGTPVCFGDGSGAPCPCGNDSDTVGAGCTHSGGVGMRICGSGSSSIANDDLTLTMTDGPPGNSGLFYAGVVPVVGGAPLFDGLQCAAGGGARRFQPHFQTNGTVTDTGFVAQDPSGTFFVPGVTAWFQYWTRDAAQPSPCGTASNFSPAYAVTMSP